MTLTILCAAAAYLLGSIPFGKFIAEKAAHVDITQRGSKNIGATNVAREVGLKWGLLTLALDLLKGLLPVLLYGSRPPQDLPSAGLAVVGLCALLGHQFSIFRRFRGGKGVATALGVFLGVNPLACLSALLVFLLTVYKWDYVSLGSILAACAMPPLLALFGSPPGIVVGSLAAAALIVLKHRENLQRLVSGTEAKWKNRASTPTGRSACPTRRRSRSR